jgi:flagellar motor protein MotB
MTSEADDGRYWPVVAEFFVSVLAVFVVLSSAVSQPPAVPPETLERVRTDLKQLKTRGLLDDFDATEREVLMIYSTQYLGFDPCSWALASEKAREVQESARVLERLGDRVARLSIEGHADERRPVGCKQMRFGTNFELFTKPRDGGFAAMLGETMERPDDAAREARDATGEPRSQSLIRSLTVRNRVVVAGYGATRPRVPNDPQDEGNRRVEFRAVLNRTDR